MTECNIGDQSYWLPTPSSFTHFQFWGPSYMPLDVYDSSTANPPQVWIVDNDPPKLKKAVEYYPDGQIKRVEYYE